MRPPLRSTTSTSDFLAWYWLKAELIAFCREVGLSTSGSKEALTARIAAFLGGSPGPAPHLAEAPRSRDTAPASLTPQTVVVPGYRLSRRLRAFFEEREGPDFRFNQALRDFFREPAGRTLADALALYRSSRDEPARPIAAQFEFNRHMREFFQAHPDSSMEEARLAWWRKRNSRRTA